MRSFNTPVRYTSSHSANTCPIIKLLAHGRILKFANAIGSSITVTCDGGYKASGATRVTCSKDAQWAPAVPSCVRDHSVTNAGQCVLGFKRIYIHVYALAKILQVIKIENTG